MVHRSSAPASSASLSGTSASFSGSIQSALATWRRAFTPSWVLVSLVMALVLIVGFGPSAEAQTLAPTWSQQTPASSPSHRYIDAMAFDAAHGQVVLFGGYANGVVNDTWLWNGTTWTQANPSVSPPARGAHSMVYDPLHQQVVVFGGLVNAQTRIGDTWLWNGVTWTQAALSGPTPSARAGSTMAWDPIHQQVVLFGGVDFNGRFTNDTWTWDGTNWAQKQPANSPSVRADQGMAFDVATSQLLLFGGSNGGYLNDTWVWDGSTWTQLSPSTSPPQREAPGMAYSASLGQIVAFGGNNNGTYFNDTWLWDGTNWTQAAPSTSPSARENPSGMAYDALHGQLLLFGGYSSGGQLSDTWLFGLPGNFGNVNVCPSGQITPTPCSSTVAFTYNLAQTTVFGTAQVVTQGTSGLDFTLTSNTCTGRIAGSCSVNVTFTPLAPGLRTGAIQLVDLSGNVLATTPVYGVGQGPAALAGPATAGFLSTGGLTLAQPKGVTLDEAGNVFIADTGNHRVVRVATDGTTSTVGIGLNYPQGMAVDGAGDLFIADNNLNQVVKVPAGCTSTNCQTTVGVNLVAQLGVAVDGPGNVFIASFNGHQVIEVPTGCTTASCQTAVYSRGSASNPVGVALDAAGDLFVADYGLAQVIEVPMGCNSQACQIPIGQGWVQPVGVAVDAAGNVFVADEALRQIVKVPAGCATSACQTITAANTVAVAVNASGAVFYPSLTSNQVAILNGASQNLQFATTMVGATSTDSPKSFTLQNIGNQPLVSSGSGFVVNGSDFIQVPGTGGAPDCSPTFSLTPGQSCNVSISFHPVETSALPLQGTAVFSDNALNAAPAMQTVGLLGTSIPATIPLTVTMTGAGTGTVTDNQAQISCVEANHGSSIGTCTGNYLTGTQVTLTASATGTSIFLGWGGACAVAGTNPSCTVTTNQAANVTADFVDQNFGSYNVCPAGQPVAGPCNNTVPVTFTLANTTTIGAIRVVTQGATGLDFTQATGSTCVGTIAGGSSCSVNVQFTPKAPGLRMGAVQLYDNTGNLVGSAPVYGIGQEPAIAFGPGSQITVDTGAFALSQPEGLLTDAAGNLFISDTGASTQRVLKIAPDGTKTTVGVGLQFPQGIAEDGAGNLYIADNNLNEIVEVPAGCTSSTCQQIIGANYRSQLGVAVDGSGNVFFGDFLDGQVVKNPAGCTTAACQTVVYAPGPGSNPVGITLDSAGNLFVADFGLQKVVEVPAGCTLTTCQVTVGTGWSEPEAIAVDAAGNVFVADAGLNAVVEVPVGCTTAACQLVLLNGVYTFAVAVDATGNLFASDLNTPRIVKLNRSQPPSFAFATTNVGSTSADSPQSVTVQNIGNQPLTGSLALNLGSNFTQSATPDCSAAFPLAPGALCTDTFSFTPQTATYLTGTATFADNTLNISTATQTIPLTGTGAINGQAGLVSVPNVVGQPQTAANTPITTAGLAMGSITTASSQTVGSGTIIAQTPVSGTQVAVGSAVNLLVSTGLPVTPSANPLSLENNYFVTGDYVSAGVTLLGTGIGGIATGTINILNYTQSPTQGVPDGADIVDAFLYWETLETSALPSSTNGTFNHYPIVGQQIGSDLPNFTDGAFTGTMRAYRASVNAYLPVSAGGIRIASGAYTVSLPDGGQSGFPYTEGASLVLVYRVLSQNFPLKSVVIYDGAATSAASGTQVVKGFYDAAGGANGSAKNTNLFALNGSWHTSVATAPLPQPSQFAAPLAPGAAYAAVILSTAVNNSDNDGILDAWKAGPAAPDFHVGQPGYYDVKTGNWVGLPGAKHGQKDLFVQLDYMCALVNPDGSCDSTKENLFPSPDATGNDPLAMVQQAFLNSGVQLHLQVGNAVQETTCLDDPTNPLNLCQFPNQTGVIGWKNSLEFSKLWPRNLAACATGGDCTARFPYGQKDSYHYVLFGHSLAIPAWNSRYGTLTSIVSANNVTTIATVDRGTGINACPARITLGGVLGSPLLNGIYNTTSCPDTKTIIIATPGVPAYTYPNTVLPEPVIGLTSGTVTSISGYSDLGGADSAVTLGLWLTAPNQDMSKRANVLAGTLFHEIGHTLGLSHGGLYYDGTPNSFVPTFEGNCKPNYQSVMNYLFQLDLVGPSQTIAFSNQTLATINESSASSTKQLFDVTGLPATFPTSAWYVPFIPGSPASPATRHCDGTPLSGASAYRVDSSIAPITPAWQNGQDLNFTGTLQTQERGYNDIANMDLRQVGATGGQFASLASFLNFGNSASPLNIAAGGNVTLGSGGTIALGSGGNVTLGSGGNVTLGSGGTITLGSGGNVTLGSGGNVTLGSGGTVTPGSSGLVTLGSGGNVTLGSGGTITLGSGGNITLGSGGNVTLGSGGLITLGSGGTTIVPAAGGTYFVDAGGLITLGSGGNITLGSGGNVTLGSGGLIALGSGGNVVLGSGGNVTLGSGGNITLGSGGNITLGSGGNVTLGSGGNITLGSGGNITLGSGGNVTLGSGGTVTLGSGGNLSASAGGNVTLGSGGSATLGAGGTITLGSGGNVTLGSGGNITLGSGGVIALGSGGNITLGSGGLVILGSGGTITLGSGGIAIPIPAGPYTVPTGGGTITLGSGGNITLGSGGLLALGSGGNITLGSGGTITLGSGGNVTLGSGGVVTLGTGGIVNLGTGSAVGLGTVSSVTPGSGGPTSDELSYETANSVVRPPTSPTETPTPAGILVTWKAPAFGVVTTYTVYRSSNGAAPIVIGSVSGVNGFPPATQFLDTNPDTSALVIYTIATTIAPDPGTGTPRQSPPSAPAVLKNDQTIALGPLPSSVTVATPLTVTATALSAGSPDGLQVLFTTTGSCVVGSQSMSGNVSSASISSSKTGSCTVTASQAGSTAFNAANAVSGTFMVLPQGSGLQSQTITFASLPNTRYGNTFSLSATSTSNLTVTFAASGPCAVNGTISGIGLCTITASAPGNATYSAASVTQTFTIYPAVLKVTANPVTVAYGQPIPPLTYTYSGFIGAETASVVSGAPALSTTAITTVPGIYPITVATGTIASANYSFLYVSGTLTVQPGLILVATSPLTYNQSETLSVTGGATTGPIAYKVISGQCTVIGARLTANSGTGTCQVTATALVSGKTLTSSPAVVTLAQASQTINFTLSPPATAIYGYSFPVAAIATSGIPVTFTSAGACRNTGPIFTITAVTGTCSVIASQPGSANYTPAPQVTKPVSAIGPVLTLSASTIDFGTVYFRSVTARTLTVTNTGTAPAILYDPFLSIVRGGNSNEFLALNLCPRPLAPGRSCTIYLAFIAGPSYTPRTATLQIVSNAPASPQPVTLTASVINPQATFSPASLAFPTIRRATTTTQNVTLTNPGSTPLTITGIVITGPNPTSFAQTNTCASNLAPGARCNIAVTFKPATTGTFNANLTVLDNAQTCNNGTQTIPLSGKAN